MSEMPKNHCPPKTTAPKMEVHDASEGSKDIKPKVVSTAHKNLSQDEFQRKVAMAARAAVAEDAGTEKEAIWGLLAKAMPGLAAKAAPWLARVGLGTGTKTWGNLLPRAIANTTGSYAAYKLNPWGWGGDNSWVSTKGGPVPYIGGAIHRLGSGLHSVAQGMGSTVGLDPQKTPGLGGAMGGGLVGAGIGALGGALMPGHEEYEDENGNVRRRSRGMLAGALRGAGMGGLAGAGVGAGMDYMGKQSAAQDFGAALAQHVKR